MRTGKELVAGESCHLSRVPNLCLVSILFTTACVTKSSATKSSVAEYLILEFPANFRLAVFKLCYVYKEPKCSKHFETIGTGNCYAISPYSKIHKQDNTKSTRPKDLIAGVLEHEFILIKSRCFAGCNFFSKLACWFVLALLVFKSLLLISRRPA